jgi:excisionase family DNA binding protein
MEPLLSMEQAAQLLGLTRAQLYELTRNRSRARQAVSLPVIRIGKRKMFRAAALHEWVLQLEKQQVA